MRLFADSVAAIAGGLTVAGFIINHFFQKHRKPSNLEHVKQLEAENEEMDKVLGNITHINKNKGG